MSAYLQALVRDDLIKRQAHTRQALTEDLAELLKKAGQPPGDDHADGQEDEHVRGPARRLPGLAGGTLLALGVLESLHTLPIRL